MIRTSSSISIVTGHVRDWLAHKRLDLSVTVPCNGANRGRTILAIESTKPIPVSLVEALLFIMSSHALVLRRFTAIDSYWHHLVLSGLHYRLWDKAGNALVPQCVFSTGVRIETRLREFGGTTLKVGVYWELVVILGVQLFESF